MSKIRSPDALDLFAPPPRPPSPPAAPAPAPARLGSPSAPPAWHELLARAGDPEATVLVELNEHYTGVVVAVLSLPAIGRHFLCQDGKILHHEHTDHDAGHFLLRTPDQAREIHRRTPLVAVRWISMMAHLYRAAGPGDAVSPDLITPPYHQH